MIKKILLMVLVLLGFYSMFDLSAADQFKIAFVDLQRIIEESDAGKTAQAVLKDFTEKNKKSLKDEEKILRKMQIRINDISSKEPDKAEKLKKSYRATFDKYRTLKTQIYKQIEHEDRKLTNKIFQEVRKIIINYASKKDIDYVFEMTRSKVIIFPIKSDITEEVIKLHNSYNKSKGK